MNTSAKSDRIIHHKAAKPGDKFAAARKSIPVIFGTALADV